MTTIATLPYDITYHISSFLNLKEQSIFKQTFSMPYSILEEYNKIHTMHRKKKYIIRGDEIKKIEYMINETLIFLYNDINDFNINIEKILKEKMINGYKVCFIRKEYVLYKHIHIDKNHVHTEPSKKMCLKIIKYDK